MAVAAERSTEYTALSIGCKARLALLTALGVTPASRRDLGALHGGHCAEQATWRRNPPDTSKRRDHCAGRLLPLTFPGLSTQQGNADRSIHFRRAGPPGESRSVAAHRSVPAVRTQAELSGGGEHVLAHVAGSGPRDLADAVLRSDQDRCLCRQCPRRDSLPSGKVVPDDIGRVGAKRDGK